VVTSRRPATRRGGWAGLMIAAWGEDARDAMDGPGPHGWRRHLTDEDRAVLAAGGFAASSWTGARPGLLVVDAQYGFVGLDAPILESVRVYPTSVGERAWRAVERIAELLSVARARGLPVVFSQSGVPPGETGFDPFAAKVTAVRAPAPPAPWPAYALVAPLAPRPAEPVVRKRCASAFFGSPLASVLRHLRVESLVVCGFTTSGCVRATLVDAASHGFPVTLVADACADRVPLSHDVALLDVDGRYADVLPAPEAAARLER
jgi:maleamate amidohydrolase